MSTVNGSNLIVGSLTGCDTSVGAAGTALRAELESVSLFSMPRAARSNARLAESMLPSHVTESESISASESKSWMASCKVISLSSVSWSLP